MSALESREFNALTWVKPALDETLANARAELAAHVESPERDDALQRCLAHLHEVQGSLRMVESYGAAMVVENMERLVEGLLDNSVRQRDEAYSVLMRGMVQLPDYLERLQGGYKDIPIVLLPLLNDLRASRGEALLSESSLFAPDLDAPLPAAADGAALPLVPGDLRAQAMRARLGFQAALLKWFRDVANSDHLQRLIDVLDQLRAISHGAHPRRLWWIAGGFVESLGNGGIEASSAIKLLLGRVDREIHRLAHAGETVFAATPPRELERNLLYYVANSTIHAARAAEILRVYRLDSLLPTESELAHAQGSMTGHNRQLLDTVAIAIKDDLLRIKEALDIFLRGHGSQPAELEAQAAALDRVGDTLGMLGLGVPRRVVGEQRKVVAAMAERQRPIDEGVLLDVASALLYVETSLDDHIERLGADDSSDAALSGGELPGHELPQAEMRKIQGSAMDEAMANLRRCKQDIVAFVESPWDHDRVEAIPRLFAEVAGALRMLELATAGALMDALARFVEIELITHRRVPTPRQMDMLADALAALEYYLEAARDQRHHRERVLDVAKSSLAGLGYWQLDDVQPAAATARPVAAVDASSSTIGDDFAVAATATSRTESSGEVIETSAPPLAGLDAAETASAADTLADDTDAARPTRTEAEPAAPDRAAATWPLAGDVQADDIGIEPVDDVSPNDVAIEPADAEWIEVEEEVDEPIHDAAAPLPGFEATDSTDIDDGIREIFLEEVAEELASMRASLPKWREQPEARDAVATLRRSFHTLKGSGRLVGARTLGEMSWSVEQLLNRVLDGTVAAHPAVIDLVAHAIDAVAPLYAALRGEAVVGVDVAAIAATAERLAKGEHARVGDAAATRRVLRTVRRRVAAGQPAAAVDPAPPADPADVADDVTDHVIDGAAAAGNADAELSPFDDAENPATAEVAAHAPLDIDPVLFDILQTEVTAHLATIEGFLDEFAATPQPPSESLLRAVHTLNGAMGMVEIAPVADALAPLEGYVKRLRGVAAAPSEKGIAALHATVGLTRETMRRIAARETALPDSSGLTFDISALRDALPDVTGPLSLYGIDDEAAIDEAPADDSSKPTPSTPAFDSDETGDWLRESGTRPEVVAPAGRSAAEIPDELIESLARFDVADAEQAATSAADDSLAMHADGIREISFTGKPPDGGEANLAAAAPEADSIGSPFEAAADIDDDGESDDDRELHGSAAAAERAAVTDLGEALDTLAAMPDAASLRDSADAAPPRPIITAGNEILVPRDPDQAAEKNIGDTGAADIALPAAAILPGPAAPPLAADAVADGALDTGDVDDDLLDVFVQEAVDILDSADDHVASLRRVPDERTAIAGLQRDLHTLKGGARMAGLAPIGDLCHALESLVDALADGRREVDRASVEVLESGFDRMQKLVQRVARRSAIAMPVQTIRYLADFVAGSVSAVVATPPPDDGAHADANVHADAVVPGATADARLHDDEPRIAEPAARSFAAAQTESAPFAAQEMIRVRSGLLDALANHAGEVSIYRSRLEQQISTFRFNLVEFDSTVSRLRDQLRKLEIETEAQIIARYQREHETASGSFDPLELDRFSQLQQLSRALGESVSDLVSIQGLLDEQTRQAETLLLQQQRVSSDLQQGLMQTRMVPFDSMVPTLRRTLRQTAREVGKRAQLSVAGAHGEMDRNLLERMKAPFEHMLRNALAHGIESADERRAAGKPAEGQVNIAVGREATEVVLRLSDDGRGMDRAAIRAKAIERGLLKADAAVTDADLFAFVLESGFSTAGEVTQLAGRGVGMDVVANEIKQLGGSLAIDSTPGQGTRFTIRLPFTLAVTQAILVSLGPTSYAIPMASVLGVVRVSRADLDERLRSGDPRHDYVGETFLIRDLAQLLGIARPPSGHDEQIPLLMTRSGEQRIAVRVDSVIGSREIVVKPVGPQVSSVPGIFGATITGDGAVVVILDLPPLVRRLAALRERIEAGIVAEPEYLAPQQPFEPVQRSRPLVMVVDDSITMRKVTTRVLERADLDVVTAKDGLDALEKLQSEVPDLMLLDIEMPRMDGYELATYMRNDARMRRVPIIMITSRTGEKHRQRALEIGVEHYLGKPYQEDELMRHVLDMLEAGHE